MVVRSNEKVRHPKLHELYVLLNTQRGTVPLKRDLGIDGNLVDKPINIIQSVIAYELQKQIKKYITGLELREVQCSFQNSELVISCEVDIYE